MCYKISSLSLLLFITCQLYASVCQPDTSAFKVFDNAGSEVPYRIPAMAQNIDGDIIALADYRYSKADIGMVRNGKVDIRYRIKDHKSGKWGEIYTLVSAFGEGDNNIAFGDPCVVADRDSNELLVLSCMGNVSFPKGTNENHQGVAMFRSVDGGYTWSTFEDIGNQFLNQLDKRANGPVRAFFIASGKIAQSEKIKIGDYYRLYCALLVKDNEGANVNYVFFSDDFGHTWQLLGDIDDCPVPEGADEAKIVKLPDGRVAISSRVKGGRVFNVFHYTDKETGKGFWQKAAHSNKAVNGVEASSNACNGGIICVPVLRNHDNYPCYLLLQSVPLDENGQRAKVGINYKEIDPDLPIKTSKDMAEDWAGKYVVSSRSSAYSTMLLNRDKTISFFFEENAYNGGYDLIYKEIPLETITSGAYSIR